MAAYQKPRTLPVAWHAALPALVLLIAVVLLAYRETALAMVTIWYRSETFTHGFVVLPITLWLIWRQRALLAAMAPRPNFLLLIVVAGLALMWMMGDMVAVNSVTQLALVAMLVATVPAVLGVSVAAAIAFPLAFMFFAVPIGEFIMPQLMSWTADFTILALRMSGVPVFREGLNFVIPTGSWSVVEACSGVRYLIASLTVGTLYAYLNYQSTRRRLLFVLVSILVPIIANWMRAYMIVMLGHVSGNTIAVGVDHLIYGWVFFGVVILGMFMIGARWSEPELTLKGPLHPSGVAAPRASRFWFAALAVAVIASLPMFARMALESNGGTSTARLLVADAVMLPWGLADASSIGFKPHYENTSDELNAVYVQSQRHVGLYLGYYRNQDYDRKLVSSNNVLVRSDDTSWRPVHQGTVSTAIGSEPGKMRWAELRRMSAAPVSAPERLLVRQIYWINGRLTSNDYLAKVYSAVYQLLGRGDDSAVIVVYTSMNQANDAEAALTSFLSSRYGAIDAALRAVSDSRQP